MAEIIGLTASILTFIEFSAAIISTARSVHAATDGMCPEIQELLKQSNEVTHWHQQMSKLKATRDLSLAEHQIMATAGDCDKTVEDLRGLIAKVSIRPDARVQSLERSRVVLRLFASQSDLKRLQARLKDLD